MDKHVHTYIYIRLCRFNYMVCIRLYRLNKEDIMENIEAITAKIKLRENIDILEKRGAPAELIMELKKLGIVVYEDVSNMVAFSDETLSKFCDLWIKKTGGKSRF